MLNQSSRRAQTLRNFRWPPFEAKQRNEKHFCCRFTSFTECEITADRDIARGAMIFPGSPSALRNLRAGVSGQQQNRLSRFYNLHHKAKQPASWRKKKLRAIESETKSGVFNSLHTDARLYVGAIRYYVSLHTPAESMLASLFCCCCCSRLVFLSFFCCFIHVYLFSSLLYFYTTYYGNQIGLDHDRMCRKDV